MAYIEQVQRLLTLAVEEQVVEGKPRDLVEAKDMFRLVAEQFMGKVRHSAHSLGNCRKRISSIL